MRRIFTLATLPLAASCVPENPPAVGAPNPASAYCVQQGGRVEIRTTAAGEAGWCHLPDGRVVEEWTLYRAANP